jgi:hypothetical protein
LNLRFKVKTRNLTPLGEYDPQLTVVETKRIVGYPAFSDILVYDLDSGSHQVFTSTSTFFASKRNPPVYFGDKEVDIDSFELLEEWQKEVCYGSITFLKDKNKYIRFVKRAYTDEDQVNAPRFLKVFDKDFKKVKEFDLTSYNSDLSFQYLDTGFGIML